MCKFNKRHCIYTSLISDIEHITLISNIMLRTSKILCNAQYSKLNISFGNGI
jgi:hypothetical protein